MPEGIMNCCNKEPIVNTCQDPCFDGYELNIKCLKCGHSDSETITSTNLNNHHTNTEKQKATYELIKRWNNFVTQKNEIDNVKSGHTIIDHEFCTCEGLRINIRRDKKVLIDYNLLVSIAHGTQEDIINIRNWLHDLNNGDKKCTT